MRVHIRLDTVATPDQVVEALTDFSDRRPSIWPDLDPVRYRLHERGDTHAEVTEGNVRPRIWAREHYDWSQPGRVSWRVIESNFCKPGSGIDVQIEERSAGGSHLEIDWERKPAHWRGWALLPPIRLMVGPMIAKSWTSVFDRYAATERQG